LQDSETSQLTSDVSSQLGFEVVAGANLFSLKSLVKRKDNRLLWKSTSPDGYVACAGRYGLYEIGHE
jgi:hypothetical protein